MSSWDRQLKEPSRAYHHFTLYRDLGPERTLGKTSTLTGLTEGALQQESWKWNWTERCDQWDAHVRNLQDRAFLSEAARQAKERAKAYGALLKKTLKALDQIDLEKATLAQVAQALDIAAKGLRLEDGLETSRIAMEVTDARVILSRLPAEVRAPLLRALDRHADAGRDSSSGGGVPLGLGDEPGK